MVFYNKKNNLQPMGMQAIFIFLCLNMSLAFTCAAFTVASGETTTPAPGDEHFRVIVYDADLKTPIELARVVLRRDGTIVEHVAVRAGPRAVAAVEHLDLNLARVPVQSVARGRIGNVYSHAAYLSA